MTRPIIGILLDYEESGSFSVRPHYAIRTAYFDTIWKAGGLPIALPYINSSIKNYLSICKGLLLPGGEYPFPNSAYDCTSDNKSEPHVRFEFEKALIKAALDVDLPILGICAGMQAIVVVCGGKLYRNINVETNSNFDHLNAAPAENTAHKVFIKKETLLKKILKVTNLDVNTAHIESAKTLPPNLVVNAMAPDGIIEGVEMHTKRFCLGVQWHPEFLAKSNNPNFNLFKSLVSNSREY